jgi:two-component system, chemotaxis family, sensor kinase CheA
MRGSFLPSGAYRRIEDQMSTSTDIRQTFFQECEELLEALDDGLTQIGTETEDGEVDLETVNAVFRAVHSIKGGAAAFGLESLVRFAHQFETTLDEMRSGRLAPTETVLKIYLRAADHLADLVSSARDNVQMPPGSSSELIEKLTQLVSGGASAPVVDHAEPEEEVEYTFKPLAFSFDFGPTEPVEAEYTIRFSATRTLFANGNDPVHLFRTLGQLGRVSVHIDTSALVPFDVLDWAESYFSWELTLHTTETHDAIAAVFEFVEGCCTLEIEEKHPVKTPLDLPSVQPDFPVEAPPPPPVASKTTPAPPQASKEAAPAKSASSGQKGTVRVDLDLVDRLINIVGELVINQAVLAQCVQDSGITGLTDVAAGLDEFKNLAREIQENVMAIRAQSVKPLFQRMARIVREASDLAGKSVRFETVGEATEVDKTVIERLVDPLTHIIRNAVDHGLESKEARIAAGKAEIGCVTLSAAHRSGRVIIEVSDDGGGINRARVRQVAIDKGLIDPDLVLTDADTDKLLFLPGFSTASKVSDLSGRGVGMDVVRSAIQSLGGRVNIMSNPGKGTTLSISLPLTLAVLDGMVVDVAGQTMVIPITAIVETLRPTPQDLHQVGASGQVVSVRGSYVTIVDLAEVFGYRSGGTDYAKMVLLLVESGQNDRWALAVDKIYDQRQVVIKGLETNYGHVPGVAAATILGDGKIALIIDPEVTALRPRAPSMPEFSHVAEEF